MSTVEFDQGLILSAISHQLKTIEEQAIILFNKKNYTSNDATEAEMLFGRANELKLTQTRVLETGNPLTGDVTVDQKVRSVLTNAMESFHGKEEGRKIGTDRDGILEVLDDEIHKLSGA